MLSLRGLEALRAFMETGSITNAALRLHRTQPQVSRLLASLEDSVGFPLFERRKRRLYPTDKCREFYRHAEHVLAGFDDLTNFAHRARTQHHEHVRVLTAPHVTDALVADAMAAMVQESPGFTATIDSRTRGGIEFWVERERFDLAITVLPFEHPLFEVEEFIQSSAVALMSVEHPQVTRPWVTVEDILSGPLIATSPPSVLRQRFERMARSSGMEPSVPFETPNGAIACQLAARGMGIALADPFVALSTNRSETVLRRFEPAIELRYAFLFPIGQPRSPAVAALAKRIAYIARERLDQLDRLTTM